MVLKEGIEPSSETYQVPILPLNYESIVLGVLDGVRTRDTTFTVLGVSATLRAPLKSAGVTWGIEPSPSASQTDLLPLH
jgi:hypothetical protein